MMKKVFLLVILVTFVFSPSLSQKQKGMKDKVSAFQMKGVKLDSTNQWAFIIGINRYRHLRKLEYAVPEAKKIKRLLEKKYGYSSRKIITLLDERATYSTIVNQLKWYVKNLDQQDNLFIYFSGHGYKDDVFKKGFWMPCDSGSDKQGSENKATETLVKISNHDVVDALRECKARHIFVVADSCFSGQFFASQTKAARMPGNHFKLKSRQLFTSGRELVGDGEFGKYFASFLEKNDEPYLLASDVISKVRGIVVNNTEFEPEGKPVRNTGDEGGEFILQLKHLNPPPDSGVIDVSKYKQEIENTKLKQSWDRWQQNFQASLEKVKELEISHELSPESKKEAWERVLNQFRNDNPFSSEDEKLREYVNNRIRYWQNVPVKTKATPQSATNNGLNNPTSLPNSIQKVLGAYNGYKSLKSMTIEWEGQIHQPNSKNTIKVEGNIVNLYPHKFYSLTKVMGLKHEKIVNGNIGWSYGMGEPQPVSVDDIEIQRIQDIYFILNYPDKYKITKKIKKIKEKTFHVIHVIDHKKNWVKFFVNTKNGFIEIIESQAVKIGKTNISYNSDFRIVEGIPFPYKIESNFYNQIQSVFRVNSVSINPPVDENLFKKR